MGGYAFETTSENEKEFVTGSPKLVLTRIGLNYMIEHGVGRLPVLSAGDIKDLGKADSVAKGLVCFQATFIVAQSIARCMLHYPVSLLEINTVGHAVCALLMYGFWFRKPKDVRTQQGIRFERSDDLAAFLYFGSCFEGSICPGAPDSAMLLIGRASEDSTRRSNETASALPPANRRSDVERASTKREVLRFAHIITKIERFEHDQKQKLEEHSRGEATPHTTKDLLKAADPLRKRTYGHLLTSDKVLQSFKQQLNPTVDPFTYEHTRRRQPLLSRLHTYQKKTQLAFQGAIEGPAYDWYGRRGMPCKIDSAAITRLQKTADFIETRLAEMGKQLAVKGSHVGALASLDISNGVVLEAPNWPTQVGCRGWSVMPQLGMAFVTVCYGGFHTVALIEEFPSQTEKHLWMLSCICLASSGIVVSGYALAREAWKGYITNHSNTSVLGAAATHDQRWHTRFTEWLLSFALATLENSGRHFFFVRKVGTEWDTHFIPALMVRILVWLGALAAVASRIFIVVEAFISLRRMPEKMYETPDWPSWIPHL